MNEGDALGGLPVDRFIHEHPSRNERFEIGKQRLAPGVSRRWIRTSGPRWCAMCR